MCYIRLMPETTKDILRRIESWPQEDQDELVQVALEIEARRNGGAYELTAEEASAVRRALQEMRARRFASDEDIAAIFRKARSSDA
jgi:hypothetical protein